MEKECRDIVEKFINKYSNIITEFDLYDLRFLFKNFVGKNIDLRVKKNQEMWYMIKKYYNSVKEKKNAKNII